MRQANVVDETENDRKEKKITEDFVDVNEDKFFEYRALAANPSTHLKLMRGYTDWPRNRLAADEVGS